MPVHDITGSTIRASFGGIAELRRDLDSVELGLGRQITEALRGTGAIVAGRTATLTPRGPGPYRPRSGRPSRSSSSALPHMAETITARAATAGIQIESSHPASGVFEYAGQGVATIAPRGVPITIRRRAMAHRAGEQLLPQIEHDVVTRIDALLRAHGL